MKTTTQTIQKGSSIAVPFNLNILQSEIQRTSFELYIENFHVAGNLELACQLIGGDYFEVATLYDHANDWTSEGGWQICENFQYFCSLVKGQRLVKLWSVFKNTRKKDKIRERLGEFFFNLGIKSATRGFYDVMRQLDLPHKLEEDYPDFYRIAFISGKNQLYYDFAADDQVNFLTEYSVNLYNPELLISL